MKPCSQINLKSSLIFAIKVLFYYITENILLKLSKLTIYFITDNISNIIENLHKKLSSLQ